MISAVLDKNVVLQDLIGHARSASARVLDLLLEGRFGGFLNILAATSAT